MEHTEAVLNKLAHFLDEYFEEEFGKKIGFALIAFEFYMPGIGNYVSNGRREDVIKTLRETADRIERNEVIPPTIGDIQ